MAFPVNITQFQASGAPGELANFGPIRVDTHIYTANTSAVQGNYGYALFSDGNVIPYGQGVEVVSGSTGALTASQFAGIAILPKTAALRGLSADTLQPSMQILYGHQVEACTGGRVWVTIDWSGAAIIYNQAVQVETATGQLTDKAVAAGIINLPNVLFKCVIPAGAAGQALALVELTTGAF